MQFEEKEAAFQIVTNSCETSSGLVVNICTDEYYKGQEMGPFIFLENFGKKPGEISESSNFQSLLYSPTISKFIIQAMWKYAQENSTWS